MSLSKYSFDLSTTKAMPVGIRKRSREDSASVFSDSQAEQEVDDVFETKEVSFDAPEPHVRSAAIGFDCMKTFAEWLVSPFLRCDNRITLSWM